MPQLVIRQIPVLRDNYIYLLHEPGSGATAVVDPALSEPVLDVLAETGWRLSHILNTHHHPDHVGGNLALKETTGATIVGPQADRDRIPGIEIALAEGDGYALGSARCEIFDIPGHTRGHIAFWFRDEEALFCGDTLFLLGCGRLFEGTPGQMWGSLQKIRALPEATRIYCAHEYTLSNARFAFSIDPQNTTLARRVSAIEAARAANRPTVPGTLGEERATNPFLRADDPALQLAAGMPGADPVEVFAAIRRRKDTF